MYLRIREIRKAKKLTQEQFAKLLSTNQQAITKYEKGTIKPSELIIKRLKQAIPELNLDWLITGSGDMFINSSIVTGDIKGNNITLQNNAKCECLEDKELEMLHSFRKLSDERRKYYYHKIVGESLE